MKKFLIGGAVAFAMMLPFVASASVNNVLFDNGTGNVTVSSGSEMNVHLYVTSTGTDVESIFVKFPGAGGIAEQGVCYDISPDQIGTSPVDGWNITFPVTAPVNAGTWPISFATYGVGGNGADNTCSGSVGFGPTQFSSRVTVTTDNSVGTQTQNTSGTGSSVTPAWQLAINAMQTQLSAAIAAMTQAIANLSHPTTPVSTSAVCTSYAQANTGTVPNTYNDANVRLQGFLLSQGASIPALKAGASFGFYGNQTTAAVGWFNSLNHCN